MGSGYNNPVEFLEDSSVLGTCIKFPKKKKIYIKLLMDKEDTVDLKRDYSYNVQP